MAAAAQNSASIALPELSTCGLGEAAEAQHVGLGRWRLSPGRCSCSAISTEVSKEEIGLTKVTDISRMKGQYLIAARNAKLIVVNLRYMVYAMKEGSLRVINQNGKDMFKLSNSTKAPLLDLAINGIGKESTAPTNLLAVDEAGRINMFLLDSKEAVGGEERTTNIEISFAETGDAPARVLGHPLDTDLFVTVHVSSLRLWNLRYISKETGIRSGTPEFISHSAPGILSRASMVANLWEGAPGNTSAAAKILSRSQTAHKDIRDAAVTVDGTCLVALTADALLVWRIPDADAFSPGSALLPVQQLSLKAVGELYMLRFLRPQSESSGESESEAMVLGSSTGSDLSVFVFTPASKTPVGPFIQAISFSCPGDSEAVQDPHCLEVDFSARDKLAIGLQHTSAMLLLPLARRWNSNSSLAFPYVQRFGADLPANQLAPMTAQSITPPDAAHLFLYRTMNFSRSKDGKPGCNVCVHEVSDMQTVSAEEVEATKVEGRTPQISDAESAVQGGGSNQRAKAELCDDGEEKEEEECLDSEQTAEEVDAEETDHELHQIDLGESPAKEPRCSLDSGIGAVLDLPPGLTENTDVVAANGTQASTQDVQLSTDVERAPCDVTVKRGDVEHEGMDEAVSAREVAAEPSDIARASSGREASEEPATVGEPGDDDADADVCMAVMPSSAPATSSRSAKQPSQDVDYSFVKQLAASFVHGLDKKRGELAEKICAEVADIVGKSSKSSASADAATLEQAILRVREARDAQAAGEKKLQAAVRKATDAWAENSASTVSSLLSKEFGKISDGVASTLAQQLAQSRKFCEALAKGVQKSGGLATKQALEALRPPKQLQEAVGTALGEALQESLAPVFKAELRAHFEQELAPLIGQRVGEMMSSFRDRMSACLEDIAAEHERAAQQLGRDLGPVLADELKQVERIISQHRAVASGAPPTSSISEAQLDELARAVETEVVQPLQARITELTSQVQALRAEAQELEKRFASGAAGAAAGSGSGRRGPADGRSPEAEEAEAAELEVLFRSGKAEDAFMKAMHLQSNAQHQDYLARLCSLVPDEPYSWLDGEDASTGNAGAPSPLSMQAKMLLMLSLAKQLPGMRPDEPAFAGKIDWINDLWLTFDYNDKAIESNAATLCNQVIEVLDQIQSDSGARPDQALKKLKRSFQQAAKAMASRD
eukprot:TRINITY_DN59482_c0_g1_i1.p1 TRINITY_DN59482_c0_g1~~TRINITY_DN59482_c0_g1_i1.p1  ORF type:complete len:1184 (+),score=275.61 TRINITY_DN59482_c0_g1_i1:23-3553(+)